jgi:2-dehydro-3-deoxyphosphogluconate aldolase / (4S)-4-hydroxy-2-oxoglutarate aldolase
MARFTRIDVAVRMKEDGIIPVFYDPDPDLCFEVAKACYNGGLRVFEFTNRGDFAHEVFGILNKRLTAEFPDMVLGTGSVVDAPTAAIFIQMGSNFIVSPSTHEDMAALCNLRKILWIPGCGSVTEISRAETLGAEIVKVFPATQVGGPGFVKGVLGPKPFTSIMPTGGVEPTAENLAEWFNAGVYCVGMGSQLITKEILKNRNFSLLQKNVEKAAEILKKIRNR